MAEANKGAGAAAGAGPSAAAGVAAAAPTSAEAQQSAVKQVDPRMTRAAKNEEPGRTYATAGYDSVGRSRVFNLLKGEDLPTGWADAPPEGTHPNDPNRGTGQVGGVSGG